MNIKPFAMDSDVDGTYISSTLTESVGKCSHFRKAAFDLSKDEDLMKKNVVQCVSIMRSHLSDQEVQNCGALALLALCERRNLEEFIGESGGMEVVLLALKQFSCNERVVKNSLILLRSLFVCEYNRQRFRIHGGIKLLVTLMKIHFKHVGIQRVSCFLVTALSSESEVHGFRIMESGVVPRIIDLLTRFDQPKDWRMQLHACSALRNLTSNLSQCKQVVQADPKMAGIANMIDKRPNPDVVHSAVSVFRNVMTHRRGLPFPLITVRVITNAVLNFLYNSSDKPTKYGQCHEASFSLLRSALLDDDHIIPEYGFLHMCLCYTKIYLQKGEFQEHAVIGHTCACIRMLLFADRYRTDFQRIPDSIETLIQAIVVFSSRPVRVEQALLALGNAVFDSVEAQRRAEVADGLRITAETMKNNDFSATVTIAGFQAIHGICANNKHTVEKATSLSLQELCVESLNVFRDNPHVQESGLATIVTLGQTKNGVKALHRSSALKAGRRAREQFPYSQKIILLTERIQKLLGAANTAFTDGKIMVHNAKRKNIASKLLRKLSSKLTPSEEKNEYPSVGIPSV